MGRCRHVKLGTKTKCMREKSWKTKGKENERRFGRTRWGEKDAVMVKNCFVQGKSGERGEVGEGVDCRGKRKIKEKNARAVET